jgi:uncharacterized protein YndB with AHSA1/START domain
MKDRGFSIERVILIGAPRETVFRYFTDSKRFAAWWGAGSSIDPRPGGAVRIRYPNAVEASGSVVEISPPARIVFTYGYEGEGKPIPPGGSRVTVTLTSEPGGTQVALSHVCENVDPAVGAEHVQGWRYQMAVFANVVSRESQAGAAERIDTFFAAWNAADPGERVRLLGRCATDDVAFRDAYSCTSGTEDLAAHLGAFRTFMPGMTLARDGDIAQCQGTAIASWIARKADGSVAGRGRNVFELSPEGKIRCATGFWG